MTRLKLGLLIVLGIIVIMQLIPVNQTNPPVLQDVGAPQPISEILKNSCYDCHSNETHWPWYSRIAPGSFLITHDVVEGREHLNFSEFGDMDAFDSSDVAEEIIEVLNKGEMPILPYLMLHPSASLSDKETQQLIKWAKTLYPD